jgi:hypothetical protein
MITFRRWVIPHHETFRTFIQPPYSSTEGYLVRVADHALLNLPLQIYHGTVAVHLAEYDELLPSDQLERIGQLHLGNTTSWDL